MSMRSEGQSAVLGPTFLPTGLSPRNPSDVTVSTLPFSSYHNSLALREQVRQAMIGTGDPGAANPGLTVANPQSNPLAYQMLGQAGLALDQMVGRQNGRWPRTQMRLSEGKTDSAKGKARVRGGVRNDTCQYCGKVSACTLILLLVISLDL